MDYKDMQLPTDWIDHIALGTQKPEQLLKFYVEVLGFQPLFRPGFEMAGGWLLFPGASSLALHIIHSEEEKKDSTPLPHPSTLRRNHHFAIRTSHFDEIIEKLEKNNITFHQDRIPNTEHRQLWFYDPDGNGVELGEFPIYLPPLERIAKTNNIKEDIESFFHNKTVFVTGCSQGIGLEFINQLSKIPSCKVIATHRPNSSTPLSPLSSLLVDKENHFLVPLDVSDYVNSVSKLPEELEKIGIQKIDVVINNAGINAKKHPYKNTFEMNIEEANFMYQTNSLGVVGVVGTLEKYLKGGEGEGEKVRVILVSSQLASIRDAYTGGKQGMKGGATCYRMTKAANNMLMRCMAAENPDWVVVSQSPGHVQTRMGSSKGRKPPLTPQESVQFMMGNISRYNLSDSGKFFDHTGSVLPY